MSIVSDSSWDFFNFIDTDSGLLFLFFLKESSLCKNCNNRLFSTNSGKFSLIESNSAANAVSHLDQVLKNNEPTFLLSL